MTRFLTTDAGLIRLPDGSYVLQPEIGVSVPTITISGQARAVSGRFLQAAAIPTPPDGWEWRLYREGAPPFSIPDGTQDIDVGPVGEAPRPTTAYLLAEDGRVSVGQAINANFPSPQPLGIEGTIAITSAGFVGGPFTVTFPVVSFGTPLSGPTAAIRIYANQNDATPEDTETTIPTTYPAEWEGKWVQAYWTVEDIATDPTLREFASLRQFVSDDVTEPIEAGELTILRSVARGTGHSPIFTVAPRISGEIQYRSGPTTEDGPWFNVEPNPGGAAGELRLADGFDPLYPDVNVAIFSAETPRPARNDRLRFRWRPSADQPWSVQSGLYSVPNPVIVYPPATTVDVTVNSPSALSAEMYRTSPLRRVIAYAPGTVGSSVTFGTRIVRDVENTAFIVPEDYANPPIFQRPWSIASLSSGVHINGLRFRSNEGVTGASPDGTAYNAGGGLTCRYAPGFWPTRTAISSSNVNRIAITNCEFDFWDIVTTMGSSVGSDFEDIRPSGFDFNSPHGQPTISRGIRFEYNTITRTGMDCLRLYNNVNFVVRGNRSENPLVDTARASCDATRHCDFLQLTINRYSYGAYDSLVEDNWVIGVNGYYQCILLLGERISRRNGFNSSIGGFADDPNGLGDPEVYGHRDLEVRGNYVVGGHVAGYYLGGVHNLLMETNIARSISSSVASGNRPSCVLVGKNNGTIRNNVWAGGQSSSENFSLRQSGSGAQTGPTGTLAEITRSNNVISDTAVPPGWNTRHPDGLYVKTGRFGYNGGVPTAVIP